MAHRMKKHQLKKLANGWYVADQKVEHSLSDSPQHSLDTKHQFPRQLPSVATNPSDSDHAVINRMTPYPPHGHYGQQQVPHSAMSHIDSKCVFFIDLSMTQFGCFM